MNENQFGVILETILDKVNGIAEGQKVLAEGQSRLETKMNIMEKDIKFMKSYLAAIDDGLNDHEKRLAALEKVTGLTV